MKVHGVTAELVICLLLCLELEFVCGTTHLTDSDHSTLGRQARETKEYYQIRQTRQTSSKETSCSYKVALLDFPPYTMNKSLEKERGFMYETIPVFVGRDCFNLKKNQPGNCTMESIFVQNSEEMVKLITEKSVDFAFPIQNSQEDVDVVRKDSSVTLIRVFVSTGCSLIVNTKQCGEGSREQLLHSIMSQWPILAVIILLSGISGMIIWLLEHPTNKAQFSPSFTAGSPEGFWWAVVSLTTVGYGDKIPKSVPGRLFSIFWIFVGAIMLSMFTAMATNAMNTALDGTKCKSIDGKEVGVFMENTETQIVAKEFNAKIVRFSNLEEMKENLSSGNIGRVLVDRNTAFHFLDKSGLKRNRQIRLIRYIDYPMYYYLAHVNKGTDQKETEWKNVSQPNTIKTKLAECGLILKESATDIVGECKRTAREKLIPAELQTADLSDQMEGLFSTGSDMTRLILYSLLSVFLALVIIGILWEVYCKCHARIPVVKKDVHRRQEGPEGPAGPEQPEGNLIPLNRKMHVMHHLLELETRLRGLTTDLENLKGEFAKAIANQ